MTRMGRSQFRLIVTVFGTLLLAGVVWAIITSPRFILLGEIVSHFKTDRPLVALTFDDGPLGANTVETLKLLDESSVKATFFIVGQEAVLRPESLKAIVDGGHAVGNHGFSHRAFLLMTPPQIVNEIEKTDEVIKRAGYTGYIPFRAPYNYKLVMLPYYLAQQGRPDISRDVLVREGPERSAQQIADDITERVRPGSIILLHPHYDHTASTRAAIPLIVDQLRAEGYDFATVPEMLEL